MRKHLPPVAIGFVFSLVALSGSACGSRGESSAVGADTPEPSPEAPALAPSPQDPPPSARRVSSADAAAGPAAPDVSKMLAHAKAEVDALCGLTRSCCRANGQTTFDMAKCERAYAAYGMQGDLVDVREAVLRGGKVAFDEGKSAACHASILALGCKRIESATFSAVATTCSGAFRGTVRPVGMCRSSLECQPGFFCEALDASQLPSDQAGTDPYFGRCMPVRNVAALCERDEECSYRGLGRTCDSATRRCTAKLVIGAACIKGGECMSGLCTGTCVERIEELASADDCASFL